jgi:hypothetical protein
MKTDIDAATTSPDASDMRGSALASAPSGLLITMIIAKRPKLLDIALPPQTTTVEYRLRLRSGIPLRQ